jgi:16S rRNA (guanine1207-N2)-methyltransferase
MIGVSEDHGPPRGSKDGAASALTYGFARGLLEPPTRAESWTFLNARPLREMPFDAPALLECEQGFRPVYNALLAAGYRVSPELAQVSGSRAGALVVAGRYRRLNEQLVIHAWNATRRGGRIIVAGEGNSGIRPLRGWVAERAAIAGGYAKFHAQVFWLRRADGDLPGDPGGEVEREWRIAPGMFAAAGPDPGSRALAATFDARIGGAVADFGAGWGFLAVELLRGGAMPTRLDCYEAEWRSLQAAKENLAGFAQADIGFHWLDLTREKVQGPYDWIVMNPPFRAGRAAEPAIGLSFIDAARQALRRGGRLLMVANRHLPYEGKLSHTFRSVRRLEESGGYKVFEAIR